MGHENKCAHLHGHNYVVYITAEQLVSPATDGTPEEDILGRTDEIGRVVDFSVIKQVYNTWIEKHWDHGFLLNQEDTDAIITVLSFKPEGKEPKLFRFPGNPTAENIASFLLLHDEPVQALAPYHVRVVKVVVHETENCSATAEL